MKKLSYLLVALLISVSAFAQKQKPQKPNFTTEQKTQLMVKKMSVALDLSKKQTSQITPIITEHVQKMEAKHAERKANKKAQKELTSDEKFKKAMDRLDEQADLQDKMKNILNTEQYTEWKKMHRKHMHRKKAKHNKKKGMKKRHQMSKN